MNETAIRRFEAAWIDGKPVSIESCLDREDPGYLPTLRELVEIELEFQWRTARDYSTPEQPAPSPPSIEDYLVRFPALQKPEHILPLLQQEYFVRHRYGDQPSLAEYEQRFPQLELSAKGFSTPEPVSPVENVVHSDGDQRGRYVLLNRHGEGAFGRVWAADDPKLGRRIAIKELTETASEVPELRERFLAEARITSQLEHPGVVPVYELEELSGDQPYYTMKLVSGRTLEQAIDAFHTISLNHPDYPLEQAKLLNSFLSVCRTMEYAHARGIIHRDLKPANIILGEYGETIVLDWGLAKHIDRQSSDSSPSGMSEVGLNPLKTRAGSLLGTPAFMSPEQAESNLEQIDQLTDVYALGAVLYRLLTNRMPFVGKDLATVLKKIKEEDPAAPRHIVPEIPTPLEAICLKAMARRREDRYQSVAQLRSDMERYLADEPVSAWKEPLYVRWGRWANRNRSFVSSVVVALIVATILFGIGTVIFRSLYRSEQDARALADQKTLEANENLSEAKRQAGIAEERLTQVRRSLYASQLMRVSDLLETDPAQGLEILNDAELCPPDLQDFSWNLLKQLSQRTDWVMEDNPAAVRCLAVTRDANMLVSGDANGSLQLWELSERAPFPQVRFTSSPVHSVVFVGGLTLASVYENGNINLSSSDKLERQWANSQQPVNCVAYSPHFRVLAAGGANRVIRILNIVTGEVDAELTGHEDSIFSLAFHPEQPVLASAGKDSSIRIWNIEEKNLISELKGHLGWVSTLAFSHSGKELVSGSVDGSIKIWDWNNRQNTATLPAHAEPVSQVMYLADDQRLATASYDKTISVWNLARQDRLILSGHEQAATSLVVLEDDRLVSGGLDHQVRQWDARRLVDRAVKYHHQRPITAIATSQQIVASADYSGAISVWKPDRGEMPSEITNHSVWVNCLAFDSEGSRLASGDGAGIVQLWDLQQDSAVWTREVGPLTIKTLAYSPDNKHLAVSIEDTNECLILNATDGKEVQRFPLGNEPSQHLTFLQERNELLVGTSETISVWNIEKGKQENAFETPNLKHFFAGPDGKVLILFESGDAQVCDWKSGKVLATLANPASPILCADFSQDGQTIATGSADHKLRLWDATTGQLRATVNLHTGSITSLAFGPEDAFIMTGSNDQFAKVWWAKPSKKKGRHGL